MKTRDELKEMQQSDIDYADEHRAEARQVQDQDAKLATLSDAIAEALMTRSNYLAERFGG
jgi:hypothetical protein